MDMITETAKLEQLHKELNVLNEERDMTSDTARYNELCERFGPITQKKREIDQLAQAIKGQIEAMTGLHYEFVIDLLRQSNFSWTRPIE